LTRETLTPFEVAVIGGPEHLSAAALEALRWFVEARGGIAVFVPDQQPAGPYLQLAGVSGFEPRLLDAPIRIGQELLASELAIPRGLSPLATPLAAAPDGAPAVFLLRRGAGAVIFSGALDAWRHRGSDDEAFARFWRRVIAASATMVPAALDVTVTPRLARPGDSIRVTARLRDTELPASGDIAVTGVQARAVRPAGGEDVIRLWPAAEPGVFEGSWRAEGEGPFNVTVSAGAARGDAGVIVAADAASPSPRNTEALDLLAQAAGGRAFPASQLSDLVDRLKAAYPARRARRRVRVMESPWWCLPFAALLSIEWAVRRKGGRQ
jgi:hypothetical protein